MTNKPKRKRIVRVFTDDVQGKGSWALVAKLTVREMRENRARITAEQDQMLKDGEITAKVTDNQFEAGIDLIRRHVKDWNWVDDDGEPLPNPKDKPEIVDDLTDEELKALGGAILGREVEVKNSKSG